MKNLRNVFKIPAYIGVLTHFRNLEFAAFYLLNHSEDMELSDEDVSTLQDTINLATRILRQEEKNIK